MSRLRELQERLRRRKCASHNVDMVVTGTRRGKVVGSCDRHGAPPLQYGKISPSDMRNHSRATIKIKIGDPILVSR